MKKKVCEFLHRADRARFFHGRALSFLQRRGGEFVYAAPGGCACEFALRGESVNASECVFSIHPVHSILEQ